MKNNIFLIITLITSISISQAQITFKDHDGNAINDGQEFNFAYLGENLAEVGIKIINNTSETVNIFGEVMTMNNASGLNLQFCLGDACYYDIQQGNSYPTPDPLTLAPGAENGDFDHFFNNYPGNDTSEPVFYQFRFYQVDDSGNEIGDILTFSYTYDANLSTDKNNFKKDEVNLFSSVIDEKISFESTKKVTITLYTITGKKVYYNEVNSGINHIDIGDFSSGIYIIQFSDDKGQETTKRIVKK